MCICLVSYSTGGSSFPHAEYLFFLTQYKQKDYLFVRINFCMEKAQANWALLTVSYN